MSAELREQQMEVMNAVMDAVSAVEPTHCADPVASTEQPVNYDRIKDETAIQLLSAVSSVLHDMAVGSVDEGGVGGKRPSITRTSMKVRAGACMGIINKVIKRVTCNMPDNEVYCEWKMIDGLSVFYSKCGTSFSQMSRFCPHCGLRIKNVNNQNARVSDDFNMG